MTEITPILMPKWGLSMQEGKLTDWHIKEGDEVKVGDEIMDVETDKITNVVEAADGGTVRRIVGTAGEVYPVRALLAVMAPSSVSDADIEAYVSAYETPVSNEEDEDTGPAYHVIELPIGKIRYAEQTGANADQTPIILIHGFGGDLDNWLFNIDALAEHAPVYALDLPGHGQSVKSVDPGDPGIFTQTLLDFMDHCDIRRAHLVGHSMGGLVAGSTALDHSDRVASLTLICSAGLGEDINKDYIDGFVTATGRKDLKPVLTHLFHNQSLVSRAMVQDLLKYKRLDGVQDFLTQLSTTAFKDGKQARIIADKLATLDMPITVIWGENDAIIPASHAENLPDVKPHVLGSAGHMVQMEHAGEVNKIIAASLG
ncbi:acetoin dehydrogenase dihydrolipoyllysine-residue acetyltransferase subunit [Thalassospira sp. TSL5-1]|uniref:acetoin dehydrogenase dihydrolipoyllysine-residue acetyltransferase subunit n=1 Tax=Thalassospira sp. TSL5-1 TaxID=1544451 RepID=UPI00093B82DE|nr:acetoin dehydrogenase dihydrolipoyllysine-residue acetyltransferase subunit [Thalassospira sp. TSL5-1]OKH86874.1 acetoin dehydrogenase [Thalassospira sp. TSL5-1]